MNLNQNLDNLEKEWHEGRIKERAQVTEEDIAEVVSMWTGIPVTRLAQEETERLLQMESDLHKRIIGQDEAIVNISKAVRRARAGLKDPRHPIGVFLFLGPTGVGKTELVRALAEFMFGDEDNMIRLDMSEFQERHTVARLIGAPPGYVGYDEGGQLTETVRRKNYCAILMDEIEKAHPEIFNVLLQIFDAGQLDRRPWPPGGLPQLHHRDDQQPGFRPNQAGHYDGLRRQVGRRPVSKPGLRADEGQGYG